MRKSKLFERALKQLEMAYKNLNDFDTLYECDESEIFYRAEMVELCEKIHEEAILHGMLGRRNGNL